MIIEPLGAEPTNELVEHVDPEGAVIEVVPRSQIRSETLRHRCTYVFVLRTSGHLVVHRRAEWKSIYPGWWDVCFGGICGVGESWLRAAERELAEEAGLSRQTLHEIGSVRYEESDGRVIGRAFVVISDEPVVAVDGEVVDLDEIELGGLTAWLANRLVCHDSTQAVLPLLTAGGVVAELMKKS